MKQSGVYAIINLTTGRRYIGSSVNVVSRWYDHLCRLKRGHHHTASLQVDWSFLGAESFGWQILETVEQRCELIAAEQRWLDDTPTAYNAARRAGGGPREGFRHTAESRAKMSAAGGHRKGAKLSPEHREALRRGNLGRKKSPEELAQMSAVRMGRIITWGAKISASKKGKPLSGLALESYDRSRKLRGQAISHGKKGVPWSAARRLAHNIKTA